MKIDDLRYPLAWPEWHERTPAHRRKRANYGTRREPYGMNHLTIPQAINRLEEEVRACTQAGLSDSNYCIISSNLRVRDTDGRPVSRQREPEDPGVTVYLKIAGEYRGLPSDKFDRVADNINAVREWLNAQRQADRSGVGSVKATFTGYPALPSQTTPDNSWWRVLGLTSTPETWDEAKRAYYQAAKNYHPDTEWGDREAWQTLQSAYSQAKQYFASARITTNPHQSPPTPTNPHGYPRQSVR